MFWNNVSLRVRTGARLDGGQIGGRAGGHEFLHEVFPHDKRADDDKRGEANGFPVEFHLYQGVLPRGECWRRFILQGVGVLLSVVKSGSPPAVTCRYRCPYHDTGPRRAIDARGIK